MCLLQTRDGAKGIVVHHKPDDAEVQFDSGGKHRWVLTKAAVTNPMITRRDQGLRVSHRLQQVARTPWSQIHLALGSIPA